MERELAVLPQNAVFALDIGTRSIIGMVGITEDDRIKVIAAERSEHKNRAMTDGQIEDIGEVARVAAGVKKKLEEKSGFLLNRVFVAAAGRALKTEAASFEMEFPGPETISEEVVSRLEAGAVGEAQKLFLEKEDSKRQFFLVGYTVSQYYLDDYLMSSILEHRGRKIRADVVATFLPGEVVESLYTCMHKAGMEVAGLTLEPIAAINVAIPEKLRLLNLVMVDIGAGTSDIAVCRDGKVVGYTMATLAGDEITESIMRRYLVDFETAEAIKMQLDKEQEIVFTDILGYEQQLSPGQILDSLQEAVSKLGREIADKILQVNGGTPSAVFLAGGGSRMSGLMEQITDGLGLEGNRASAAGRYYSLHAWSDIMDIQDPEYATPLGILVSAGLNLVRDSFSVKLNGKKAKLFSNGTLSVSDILMMNGFGYRDFLGRSGKSIVVSLNGVRRIFHGTPAEPAVLKVNGMDGKISDIVRAGDEIVFIPAQDGRDAEASAADLFENDTWDLSRIQVKINGRPAGPEEPLHYGDRVETQGLPGQDGAPADRPGTEAGGIKALAEPGGINLSAEPGSIKPLVEADGIKPSADIGGIKALAEPDDIKLLTEPGSRKAEEERRGQTEFELNGKKIFLPVKKDGSPYYLMDLLEYSGLDFEHISAPVALMVNGRPAAFQQMLKATDRIEIYEEGQADKA